jgi:hypothetical protein
MISYFVIIVICLVLFCFFSLQNVANSNSNLNLIDKPTLIPTEDIYNNQPSFSRQRINAAKTSKTQDGDILVEAQAKYNEFLRRTDLDAQTRIMCATLTAGSVFEGIPIDPDRCIASVHAVQNSNTSNFDEVLDISAKIIFPELSHDEAISKMIKISSYNL